MEPGTWNRYPDPAAFRSDKYEGIAAVTEVLALLGDKFAENETTGESHTVRMIKQNRAA